MMKTRMGKTREPPTVQACLGCRRLKIRCVNSNDSRSPCDRCVERHLKCKYRAIYVRSTTPSADEPPVQQRPLPPSPVQQQQQRPEPQQQQTALEDVAIGGDMTTGYIDIDMLLPEIDGALFDKDGLWMESIMVDSHQSWPVEFLQTAAAAPLEPLDDQGSSSQATPPSSTWSSSSSSASASSMSCSSPFPQSTITLQLDPQPSESKSMMIDYGIDGQVEAVMANAIMPEIDDALLFDPLLHLGQQQPQHRDEDVAVLAALTKRMLHELQIMCNRVRTHNTSTHSPTHFIPKGRKSKLTTTVTHF
ncbi:uncharacterized protein IWZ02DRAFT_157111 [Phyllosticta citriasiana]|uniref:uncharacterized protein n=1 Tax=Phyllosticta citriasiana TaxID=595635 RepID=UPI0030FDCDE1